MLRENTQDTRTSKFPLSKHEIVIDALDTGLQTAARISPDGQRIVYSADGELWIRDVGDLAPQALVGTEGALSPFWSPDSQHIGFFQGAELRKFSLDKQSPVLIADFGSVDLPVASWGADGTIWVTTDAEPGNLWSVADTGGHPVVMKEPDAAAGEDEFEWASVLPDGRGVLCVIDRSTAVDDTIALFDGKRVRELLREDGESFRNPIFSRATGHVLFEGTTKYRGIWAFALDRLVRVGVPFPVFQDGIRASVSDSGTLVFIAKNSVDSYQLVWVDRRGEIIGKIGEPQDRIINPALSPDERKVAVGG